MEILSVVLLQFFFQLSRTYATMAIADKNPTKSTIAAGVVMTLWLATTYLGVKFIDESNIMGIIGYLVGGCAGVRATFYFTGDKDDK